MAITRSMLAEEAEEEDGAPARDGAPAVDALDAAGDFTRLFAEVRSEGWRKKGSGGRVRGSCELLGVEY